MNEQERKQFQDMQRQLNELTEYKRNKEIQQISYPLDEVSRTIIENQSSAFTVLGSMTPLTIASGVITVSSGFHEVDTESAAASDDLDTINYEGIQDGTLLVLRAVDSGRTVVLKDGTGNLRLAGDFSLTHNRDTVTLIKGNAVWYEVSRSDNEA